MGRQKHPLEAYDKETPARLKMGLDNQIHDSLCVHAARVLTFDIIDSCFAIAT